MCDYRKPEPRSFNVDEWLEAAYEDRFSVNDEDDFYEEFWDEEFSDDED